MARPTTPSVTTSARTRRPPSNTRTKMRTRRTGASRKRATCSGAAWCAGRPGRPACLPAFWPSLRRRRHRRRKHYSPTGSPSPRAESSLRLLPGAARSSALPLPWLTDSLPCCAVLCRRRRRRCAMCPPPAASRLPPPKGAGHVAVGRPRRQHAVARLHLPPHHRRSAARRRRTWAVLAHERQAIRRGEGLPELLRHVSQPRTHARTARASCRAAL
jgi:hypothetical protein